MTANTSVSVTGYGLIENGQVVAVQDVTIKSPIDPSVLEVFQAFFGIPLDFEEDRKWVFSCDQFLASIRLREAFGVESSDLGLGLLGARSEDFQVGWIIPVSGIVYLMEETASDEDRCFVAVCGSDVQIYGRLGTSCSKTVMQGLYKAICAITKDARRARIALLRLTNGKHDGES